MFVFLQVTEKGRAGGLKSFEFAKKIPLTPEPFSVENCSTLDMKYLTASNDITENQPGGWTGFYELLPQDTGGSEVCVCPRRINNRKKIENQEYIHSMCCHCIQSCM